MGLIQPHADLPRTLAGDVTEAREAIVGLIGGAIRLSPDENGTALVGEYALSCESLVFACLGRSDWQTCVSKGSGGVSWISHSPEYVDVELR